MSRKRFMRGWAFDSFDPNVPFECEWDGRIRVYWEKPRRVCAGRKVVEVIVLKQSHRKRQRPTKSQP